MKIRSCISAILISLSILSNAQLSGVVMDLESKMPVPYVNIWIKGQRAGTTSNEEGQFQISITEKDTLVFSAVGYYTQEKRAFEIKEVVSMIPRIDRLKEVIIYPEKEQSVIVDPLDGKKCFYAFGQSDKSQPWIIARGFTYDSSYAETPFVKSFRFVTRSSVKSARMNIRIYSLDQDGMPGDNVLKSNFLMTIKKGKQINEVDLSELNIMFPKEGLAIGLEWLIIPENRYEYTYTMKDDKKKLKGVSYEPSLCSILQESSENSFIYRGEWSHSIDNLAYGNGEKESKFMTPQIEVTLSN